MVSSSVTVHISVKDVQLFESDVIFIKRQPIHNPVSAYKFEYGFLVHVSHEDFPTIQTLTEYGYTGSFCQILDNARSLKCGWIKFDADGMTYDDLKQYEW